MITFAQEGKGGPRGKEATSWWEFYPIPNVQCTDCAILSITPLHPNYYDSFTLEGKGGGQTPAVEVWQSLMIVNWPGMEGVEKERNVTMIT